MIRRALVVAFLMLAACQAPPQGARDTQGGSFALTGSCAGNLTLAAPPQKLNPVAVRLTPAGCALEAAEVSVDMPGMPMHVAPVTLKNDGGVWRGELVFTMSGAWRIELRLTLAGGRRETMNYDLRVP